MMAPTFIIDCVIRFVPVIICSLSFLPETETTVNLRGAGASFPNEVYQSWQPAYRALRQKHVALYMTYEPVGSGRGKARIVANAGDVEYAGSDSLLKDSERQGKTDLVMFPTMAGGAVLAYNLPRCDNTLNLTRDHVVGIYSGSIRYWNHSSLTATNPSCQLPGEKIKVIARKDKSGTTDMFTSALSSFSPEWKREYGVFSNGVSDNDLQITSWNSSVIYMYGKGNNGMSGLVLSVPYAIGYMAVSAAVLAELPYARIQNSHGQYTHPTSPAVQAAMDSHASNTNLTVNLADGDLEAAYPIASYTYLVVYRTQMTQCDSAKEFVRYVNWFMTSKTARMDCEKQKMVPLSSKIVERIRTEILKTMTCQGESVWEAVQADIEREQKTEQTWIVAVSVTVPLFCLLLGAMLGYILWQRYKLYRMIDSDEWNIPIEDIVFFEDKQQQSSNGKSRLQCMMSVKSFMSVGEIPDGPEMLSQILQWPGKWKGNVVGVRLMEVKELQHTASRPLKKAMLWMRDSLVHINLVRFYGLAELETDRYVVGEYCAKGSMVDVLQNGKYNLNNDFKFSLASDIANGMAFLHANGVVHGLLTSSCCLIDARWTVKIGDWEYCYLLSIMHTKKSPLLTMLHSNDDDSGLNMAAFKDFWVAPEIIRAEFVQPPAFSADVFSFGIILQEIYTREDPYAEHADNLTPQQVVRAVCNNHLRPQPTEDIPIRVRQIMEIAWSDNPTFRPSFDQMVKMLRQSRSNRKTVLDSMMETMEEYTQHLEEQVAERTAEVSLAKRNMENFLEDSIPQHLVSSLANGETTKLVTGDTVQGRVYPHLGVVVMEVLGLQSALLHASSQEVLVLLSDLCVGLDNVVKKNGAYRGAVNGETQTVLVGLESETSFLDQRCAVVAHLAFDLIDFACNLAPLTSGSQNTSIALRIGINVGWVVTGIVGCTSPKFVVLGEGVDMAKSLAGCSEAGKVRVSRNVFAQLEKNLDFVSEEAGWIVCSGLEVESFWVRLRIPKKADMANSDHSVDSGVEVEKSRPESGSVESVDGDQKAGGEDEAAFFLQAGRSSANTVVKDTKAYQKFLRPSPFFQTPQQQHETRQQQVRYHHQQQQQIQQQPSLSDITEEDERQASPLFTQQSLQRIQLPLQQECHHFHLHNNHQQQPLNATSTALNVSSHYPIQTSQATPISLQYNNHHPSGFSQLVPTVNVVNYTEYPNHSDVSSNGQTHQPDGSACVEEQRPNGVPSDWSMEEGCVSQSYPNNLQTPASMKNDGYQTFPTVYAAPGLLNRSPSSLKGKQSSSDHLQLYDFSPQLPMHHVHLRQQPLSQTSRSYHHMLGSQVGPANMSSSVYTVSSNGTDLMNTSEEPVNNGQYHHRIRTTLLPSTLSSFSLDMEPQVWPERKRPGDPLPLPPTHSSSSSAVCTSFVKPPSFPRLLSPSFLDSPNDKVSDDRDQRLSGVAGGRGGEGEGQRDRKGQPAVAEKVSRGEGAKSSRGSRHCGVNLDNDKMRGEVQTSDDAGFVNAGNDDDRSTQQPRKWKASGKEKSNKKGGKSNKIHPSNKRSR